MRITNRPVLAAVLVALAVGALLRGAWLTADPPTHATLGIVWHDEGPWVHNARNRALWGTWRTDSWNPVFVAPVFTALEYAAFRAFGVGTWQARTVPVASGLLAVVALAVGLFEIGGRRPAIIGATLLATNYVFVMWNRAALMESTMAAFIVVAWAAYALCGRGPGWGLVAGAAATLAWFSKAAAAFFVAAIAIDALVTILAARVDLLRRVFGIERPAARAERAAIATLAGLVSSAAVIGAFFVLPYWAEYQFYNWQMSVSRKPSYTLQAFVDRASWLPIVHDFFTRMWLPMVAASVAVLAIVSRLRTASPAERLLVLWLLLGLLELVVHDAGNERRYVMFIPALVGLSGLTLGGARSFFQADVGEWRGRRWIVLPIAALLAYLAIASLVRVAFLADIRNSEFSATIRLSAALAILGTLAITLKWTAFSGWLTRQSISSRGALLVAALVVASDLAQYTQWARTRGFYNYDASLEIGRLLPPGTLVQGKLANGLALENQIRPIFIGRGFGNYEDRTSRRDVRYVLTYVRPSLGYESQRQNPVIKDVLDACPGWRIIRTFEVRETVGGRDQAALIDKFPEMDSGGPTPEHAFTEPGSAGKGLSH